LQKQREVELERLKEEKELKDQMLEQAAEFETNGDSETAETILNEAETITSTTPPVETVPKNYKTEAATLSFTTVKKVTVTDKVKLVKEMLKGKEGKLDLFDEAVEIVIKNIEKHLKGTSYKGNDIPGIFIEEKQEISSLKVAA
jgi:glutamine phosphoribosylpyrophosphate amidotransferase